MNPKNEEAARALGTRIRTLRLRNGLSAETAARHTGVSPTAWRNWERGASVPLLTRGAAIARALGEPVAALFTDDPAFEITLSSQTVERVRREGREASQEVAARLAAQLEPAIFAAATRKPVDIGAGVRPKRRRSRAEILAGVAEAERRKREVRRQRRELAEVS